MSEFFLYMLKFLMIRREEKEFFRTDIVEKQKNHI